MPETAEVETLESAPMRYEPLKETVLSMLKYPGQPLSLEGHRTNTMCLRWHYTGSTNTMLRIPKGMPMRQVWVRAVSLGVR